MNNEYKNKQILKSIEDCDRFINKESPRRADLRPASVQKILDDTIAHKAKLKLMLKNYILTGKHV